MNKPISIIIPVYKAEKFLSQCIESIVAQTYSDWELILVDDGSPDKSGKICDAYAANDSRIKVIHQKNSGVSSARNTALKQIRGEWVMFVDADDKLAPNALEVCVNIANLGNLDLVQFSYSKTDSLGMDDGRHTSILSPKEYLAKRCYLVTVWGALIKSQIITDNNLFFEVGLKLAEDQVFILECILHAQRIQRIGNILYYYRQNENGAVQNSKSSDCIYSIRFLNDYKRKRTALAKELDGTIIYFIHTIIMNKDCSAVTIAKLLHQCGPMHLDYLQKGYATIAQACYYSVWIGALLLFLYSKYLIIKLR